MSIYTVYMCGLESVYRCSFFLSWQESLRCVDFLRRSKRHWNDTLTTVCCALNTSMVCPCDVTLHVGHPSNCRHAQSASATGHETKKIGKDSFTTQTEFNLPFPVIQICVDILESHNRGRLSLVLYFYLSNWCYGWRNGRNSWIVFCLLKTD